jgi:ankyrin repeat protein
MNGPFKDEANLLAEVTEKVHRGSDVYGRTLDGETALHLVTGGGFETICRFLLDHGANVYGCNKS